MRRTLYTIPVRELLLRIQHILISRYAMIKAVEEQSTNVDL
jgi:hypothetical protein